MVYARKPLLVKLVAVAVVALVVSASALWAPASFVKAESDRNAVEPMPVPIVDEYDEYGAEPVPVNVRARVLQLTLIALALSDVDEVERYELFNTLYIYRNGSEALVNEPYIPGDEVLIATYAAKEVRDMIDSGEIQIVTVGNTTVVLWNGAEVAIEIVRIEVVNRDEGWTIYAEPLYNKTLDRNTVMYWRRVYANLSGYIAEYVLISLVRNVSQTHRVYVATVAERQGDRYLYAFTYANYWFKNKTTFFGDWIILPEGAPTLADYLRMVADGVRWLSANVYNGSSPGYVPTAYPQIARALDDLANNIPEELNLEVEKGYAVVTDVVWAAVLGGAVLGALIGAAGGAAGYVAHWLWTTGGNVSQWNWKEFGDYVITNAVISAVGGALWNAIAPIQVATKTGQAIISAVKVAANALVGFAQWIWSKIGGR